MKTPPVAVPQKLSDSAKKDVRNNPKKVLIETLAEEIELCKRAEKTYANIEAHYRLFGKNNLEAVRQMICAEVISDIEQDPVNAQNKFNGRMAELAAFTAAANDGSVQRIIGLALSKYYALLVQPTYTNLLGRAMPLIEGWLADARAEEQVFADHHGLTKIGKPLSEKLEAFLTVDLAHLKARCEANQAHNFAIAMTAPLPVRIDEWVSTI